MSLMNELNLAFSDILGLFYLQTTLIQIIS